MALISSAVGAMVELQIYVEAGETRKSSLDSRPDGAARLAAALCDSAVPLRERLDHLVQNGISSVSPEERLFSSEIEAWFHAGRRLSNELVGDPSWRSRWSDAEEAHAQEAARELAAGKGTTAARNLRKLDSLLLLVGALPPTVLPLQRPAALVSVPIPTEPPHLPFLKTTAALAFGIHGAGVADRAPRAADWGISDKDLANAVLVDNTTLVTVAELVRVGDAGLLLTPLTIRDLATFVEAVITRERIFHLENPDVDTEQLNRILGEPVFTPVLCDHMSEALEDIWYESLNYLSELKRHAIDSGEAGTEMRELLAGWTSLLGRKLSLDDIVSPDEHLRWDSEGRRLLHQLVDATDPVEAWVHLFSERSARLDPRDTVSECNHRGYFNERLSLSLGIPYAANTARLPIQNVRRIQARLSQRRLSTMTLLEAHHQKVAAAYGTTSVQMPFFLSVLLSKTHDLGTFLFELAEMRRAASAFRRRRVDLDQAVAAADQRAITDLNRALTDEPIDWLSLGFGALIPVVSSVLAACAAGPPSLLIAATGAVVAAIGGTPGPSRSNLVRRIFRPQFRFLNDAASEARAILDIRGHIDRLWGPEPRRDQLFEARLGEIMAIASK